VSRRIMIILAAAIATLTLTTTPAGAGPGDLEVYSAPSYSGTHVTVPFDTVRHYLFRCVSVYDLTSTVLTTSQSMINHAPYDVTLYGATGCSNLITRVSAGSQWTTSTNQTVLSVFVSLTA